MQYKLDCLSLAYLFSLVQYWQVRTRADPRVKHLQYASFGYVLALLTNIRLVWKGLQGANILPYLAYLLKMKKVLIILTPGATVISLFVCNFVLI